MHNARIRRPIGRMQAHRSTLSGFASILWLSLAIVTVSCTQPDRGYPLTPSQDHVLLPSLAPVVQAVLPAVVQVSAVVKPSGTSAGKERSAGVRRSRHQSADHGLPPAAFDELLQRFFGMSEAPIRSSGSGFIIDPDGYIVTEDHVIENAEKVTVTVQEGKRHTAQDHRARLQNGSRASQDRCGPSSAICRLGQQRYCAGRRLGSRDREPFRARRSAAGSSLDGAATSTSARTTTSCRSTPQSTSAIPGGPPSTSAVT